ncbi:male sterility protein-domain-containing protein [Rostrohypoxylon terebratum]|nr:male sterility protein-domain-containing protein [Rostrohypoxylon terebratum]
MTKENQRLLPSVVDEIAQSDPHRVLYSVARTKNLEDGFEDIDAKSFAGAVDRFSWHIVERLGRGEDFPTLTYIGPQNLLYAISVLACIKTGYKLLLISTRNTLEANLSLFEETECGTLISPTDFPLPIVKQILKARSMHHLEVLGADYWFHEKPGEKPFPYTRTFAEAKTEPFAVCHTLGSTGLPKPVIQTHATISPFDASAALPSLGYQPTFPSICEGKRTYVAFPFFHAAGILLALPGAIFVGYTIVIGPYPPSADVVNRLLLYGNNLGRAEMVHYGGGPLPKGAAELINTETRLNVCYGSTECGMLPTGIGDPENLNYIKTSPATGCEFRHFSGDLHELFIVRNPALEKYQGVFGTFPGLNEWSMKDIFLKHPTKEDLWLYKGRVDDTIVFSTGEKLNPLDAENVIEPPTSDAQKEELLAALWPSVQAANEEIPSHGRIHRNMIAFTSPDKPMLRAGKGTVQRKLTIDMYASELDAFYQKNGLLDEPKNIITSNEGSIEDVVRNIIAGSTNISLDSLSLSADLFEVGLDSLQAIVITRELNKYLSLRGKALSIDTKTVYTNPSILALTAVISALVGGRAITSHGETDIQKMQKLYELHTENMPVSGRKAHPKPSNGLVFLVTGTTGSIGSYLLDSLHKTARIRRIYCLNRGPDSLKHQQKSQSTKGLQSLPHTVQCLDADWSKPYLGLSIPRYKELLDQVTHIVHNAWQVDFNLSIDSFANQVSGVRRLVDFSSHSHFGAQLFFVSSISAAAGRTGVIGERIFEDWQTSLKTGYGESKFVSERLLDAVAKESDIPVVVCRVGQVAGPISACGMWPKHEWLPSLIASSKYLGKLPSSIGSLSTVDWIPVDILANTIVELVIHSPETSQTGATVYHAVNPQPTSWGTLVNTVAQHLGLDTVSWDEWIVALRKSGSNIEDVAQNPAIKILDFFDSLSNKGYEPLHFDTRETVRVSQTLANLGPVHEGWIEIWMRQWSF